LNPDLHTIAVLGAAYAELQELRIVAQAAKVVFTRLDWRSPEEIEH